MNKDETIGCLTILGLVLVVVLLVVVYNKQPKIKTTPNTTSTVPVTVPAATYEPSSSYSETKPRPDDFSVKYVGRQRLKESLKDPDSLQIISEVVTWEGGKAQYTARYRAKNGFGGYVEDVFFTE